MFAMVITLFLTLAVSLSAKGALRGNIHERMETAARLLAVGKAEAATRELQAVLAEDPDNVDARFDLGLLAYLHHDCREAIPNLRKALSLKPSLFKGQAMLGLCEEREGNLDKAASDLQQALQHLQNSKLAALVATNLLEIYYQSGDLNKAASLVAGLLRSHPTNQEDLFMAWRIHTELAERARDTLLLTAPDSGWMHFLLAEHYVNEGDLPDAISQYEQALGKNPNIPGIHYELGEALMRSPSRGSLDRSSRELLAALKVDPKNAGAEADLGWIAASRGELAQAEQDYRRALALQPDLTDALKGMAEICSRRGQAEQAVKYLLRARKSAPLDATISYKLASLYRKLGRTEQANKELARFEKLRAVKRRGFRRISNHPLTARRAIHRRN